MNFEQMEYIVTVANEMSISKAAEKLFISPSGMSQSITQLEKELGVIIFNRSKSGVTPTFEGKIVISKAVTLLNTIKELNYEINNYKNTNPSHLKILISPTFLYLLQDAMIKYSAENHDVTFDLVEQNPRDILQNFSKEDFDMAFLSATPNELKKDKNISYEHVHTGHICIAVGKNSPFYHYDFVTPNDLVNAKFVMYKNTDYKQLVKYTKLKFKQVLIKSNRSSILFELVKESQAILLLHEFTIKNQPMVLNKDIKIIPLKDKDFFHIDFWLIHSSVKELSDVSKQFIKDFMLHFKSRI